jgi:predicted MFS family arabinose efflux permease
MDAFLTGVVAGYGIAIPVGALAGDRLSARTQTIAVVLGNLVILAFAVVILFR